MFATKILKYISSQIITKTIQNTKTSSTGSSDSLSKIVERLSSASPLMLTVALSLTLLSAASHLQGCAVAAVPVAATGVAMATDRRSTGTIVEDQSNELKALKVCLQNSAMWKKSHISAISYNNTLLLVGQTPDENFKREIEQELRSTSKVQNIHNELTIGDPVPMAIRSEDAWITTQIKARMFGKRDLNPGRIKVVTENNIVYLMGLTTEDEEVKATEIARSTPGVEKVVQIFDRT
jgi:osmotically-inducible protein OsmY